MYDKSYSITHLIVLLREWNVLRSREGMQKSKVLLGNTTIRSSIVEQTADRFILFNISEYKISTRAL